MIVLKVFISLTRLSKEKKEYTLILYESLRILA